MAVVQSCNFAGTFVNLLAYADDLVLLAPSWRGTYGDLT